MTLSLAVVAAGVACTPWLLSEPGRLSRLIARSLPRLAADVTFQTVRIGWTGPIVLEDVRVVPRDGSTPPLAVARVEVDHGLAAIIASWGDVGRVQVQGLEARIVFDEHRRTNLAGLVRPDTVDGSGDSPQRKRSPVRMRVEVEDAVVRIAGPWAAEPWTSPPIDVRATLAPAAAGNWSEWTIDPVDLLADARLEPGVAQGVLAYIAPVLAGSTRTSGRFSLRLDAARLPVGSPADGTLSGVLAMHEVVVGPGPLVENLLSALPFRLPRPPDIRIADESHVAFQLAERRMAHDGLRFGLPLARSGQRLDIHSSGSVGIDAGDLDLRLRLPIPADLPQDRPVLAALAGKSVSIGVRGELGDPKLAFDGSIKEAAGEFVGDLVERLRTGRPPDGPAATDDAGDDTAEAVADAIGALVEEIARRRAERRAENAEGSQPPPRRLRDRLRGGQPRIP